MPDVGGDFGDVGESPGVDERPFVGASEQDEVRVLVQGREAAGFGDGVASLDGLLGGG